MYNVLPRPRVRYIITYRFFMTRERGGWEVEREREMTNIFISKYAMIKSLLLK